MFTSSAVYLLHLHINISPVIHFGRCWDSRRTYICMHSSAPFKMQSDRQAFTSAHLIDEHHDSDVECLDCRLFRDFH